MLGNNSVLIASIALGYVNVILLPNDEVILDFKRTDKIF